MPFVQKLFTSFKSQDDPDTRVGELNRIWYDSNNNVFRIQLDEDTPGGTIIGGAGGGGGGSYTLLPATSTRLGGVKIGAGITVAPNGTISVALTTGPQGYTGSAGIQGDTGYTGSSGASGSIGYTGSKGANGYAGSSGYTGSVGYVGSNGYTGSIGYTGSAGDLGLPGDLGYTGSQGDIGYTGSEGAGYTGSQGDLGYTGSQGDIGYTGSEGAGYTGSQGDIGYSGSLGYTGSQGDIGYSGSQGDTGYVGSQGDLGYSGSQGEIGYTGSQGDAGYVGSQGDVGYTGSIGYTGSEGIGYTGSQGDQGYTGSQGDSGYTGSIGYTGSRGETGYTGSTGAGVPSGGTTGQVLTKNSNDPYDTYWTTVSTGGAGNGYTGSQGITGYTGSLGYTGSQGSIGYTGSTPSLTGYATQSWVTSQNYLTAEADTLDTVTGRGNTTTHDITVGNIYPSSDNTKYLGSALLRWHTVYVGPGSLNIDGISVGNDGTNLTISSPIKFTSSSNTFDGSYTQLANKPVYATVATTGSYTDLINKPSFATVATSGSYNDLLNKPTIPSGTVTSVGGTGTVNGITLTGTVTSSGNLTLGGTLSGIGNSQLTNSTISGVSLGSNLNTLTISSPLSGTSYNGSTAVSVGLSSGYGDTQNPYASKTAKYFLAAPNAADGVPTFRAIVASDIPTLNQNTSGSAGSVANALTAGTGISFSSGTTYNGSAAITINNSDLGSSQNIFKTVAVSGQTSVTAASNTATLTLVAGTGISLTTDNSAKSVTITANGGSPTFTNVTVTGQIVEPFNTYSTTISGSPTITFNCATGNIWRITGTISSTWTAAFTNVQITTGQATNITMIVTQGATAYVPSGLTINSNAATITWQGGSAPPGNANKQDAIGFSVLQTGASSYVVYGQLVTFG